ncbi:hypothetical protein EJB05_31578 [Eragrostis curvula]|uniref:Cathepsin propeptide inhibitor domain-containing protein n=1 Tax=Eragrostis curvula TaxID=38414 RepID=A0A5J9UF03_9POAL|nr:hypothetical protein EJB05_31578 [Eragrostis curvula]
MASKAAAAGRRVALGIRGVSPRFPRVVPGDTTAPIAAWARPMRPHTAAAGPSCDCGLFRRDIVMIPGDHSPATDPCPPACSDPYAPDDPEDVFDYGEKDLKSEEAMWAMYERWCAFYQVKRGRDDMLRRFGLFKERARQIHEFNKSGAPFTKGLNVLGDATAEERKGLLRRQLM